ncbi:hypothetical protein GYB60_02095, partial [bacterium]|nr:hypothetical protein [bacterium]
YWVNPIRTAEGDLRLPGRSECNGYGIAGPGLLRIAKFGMVIGPPEEEYVGVDYLGYTHGEVVEAAGRVSLIVTNGCRRYSAPEIDVYDERVPRGSQVEATEGTITVDCLDPDQLCEGVLADIVFPADPTIGFGAATISAGRYRLPLLEHTGDE